MIYSSIYANDNWGKYPKAIQLGLTWLRETDLASLQPGNYEIEGTDIYAEVQNPTQKRFEDSHPEMHYDHIDIQYIVDGGEIMGVCPKADNYTIIEENPSKDLYYTGPLKDESFLVLSPGDYVILFPNDLHRTCVCREGEEPISYHKVIVKVLNSLISETEEDEVIDTGIENG